MATDDVIHGGEVEVSEQVDNMWQYLPLAVRKQQEAALIERARRAYPWAPKRLAVRYGQGHDHYHYLTVAFPVPDHVRARAVEEALKAAEQTRCACGSHGSWERSVSGTSGVQSVVWAGCKSCSGQAIGCPILATDLAWYRQYERRAVSRR